MAVSYNLIFGLSADPIHLGHEQAIVNAVQFLRGLDLRVAQLCLIPVYQPNLIADKLPPVATFAQRVKMCELAAARLSEQLNVPIVVSEVEKHLALSSGENNYSLNTIKQLNLPRPLFMLSADHFQGRWPKFRKWFAYKEILKHCGLVINQRPGHKINKKFIEQLREINAEIYLLQKQKSVDTSSTEIRGSFYQTDRQLPLSDDVRAYIFSQQLYKADNS